MCNLLFSPGVNPTAVNKYIIISVQSDQVLSGPVTFGKLDKFPLQNIPVGSASLTKSSIFDMLALKHPT